MKKLTLKENQKIAIYSRKSKFTGKGESIGSIQKRGTAGNI